MEIFPEELKQKSKWTAVNWQMVPRFTWN